MLRGCVWLCEQGCSLALVSGHLQHWPLWWCAGSRTCWPLSLQLMDSVAPWRVGCSGSRIEPVSLALAGRFFTTRETPYRGSLQNDIFLSSFTSVALTVTSNARVSLHTDSVSGETTAGVLGQGGGACRVQRGLREEFRIQLFQTGPHFHPFIQLLKRCSVSEKGWKSLRTPETAGVNNEAHVLPESEQSLWACRVRTCPCHGGRASSQG